MAKARRATKAKARKKVGAKQREPCDNNRGRIYVIGGKRYCVGGLKKKGKKGTSKKRLKVKLK